MARLGSRPSIGESRDLFATWGRLVYRWRWATLVVSALLLVVFEFNEPFAGVVRVTPGAFQLALARMAQIP